MLTEIEQANGYYPVTVEIVDDLVEIGQPRDSRIIPILLTIEDAKDLGRAFESAMDDMYGQQHEYRYFIGTVELVVTGYTSGNSGDWRLYTEGTRHEQKSVAADDSAKWQTPC